MRAMWSAVVVFAVALGLAAACSKEPPRAAFRASCQPNSALDGLDCAVENVGKQRGRACMTARVQPPKGTALVAQRLCTAPLEPGARHELRPKFHGVTSLQPQCSPDGTWVCKHDVVETPEMLGENIPGQR